MDGICNLRVTLLLAVAASDTRPVSRLGALAALVAHLVAVTALDTAHVLGVRALARRVALLIAVAALHNALLVAVAGTMTLLTAVAASHRLTIRAVAAEVTHWKKSVRGGCRCPGTNSLWLHFLHSTLSKLGGSGHSLAM